MPSRTEDNRVIRIETWADHKEFAELKQELEGSFGLTSRAELFYPTRALAATRAQFSAPPPYEVFLQVIAGVGSLVKLAEILYRFLKKPVPKRDGDGKNEPRAATLKIDGKEMTIRGNWTSDELKLILETFSKQITDETSLSLLETTRKNELRKELSEIQMNLPKYEELVRVGKESRKKEWKEKLREYEKRYEELRGRAESIRELLEKDSTRGIT